MSPPGCQKMWVKPCNRNAEESFPVLSLKSREQKPPNHLLIQDKDVLQPRLGLSLRGSPGARAGTAGLEGGTWIRLPWGLSECLSNNMGARRCSSTDCRENSNQPCQGV